MIKTGQIKTKELGDITSGMYVMMQPIAEPLKILEEMGEFVTLVSASARIDIPTYTFTVAKKDLRVIVISESTYLMDTTGVAYPTTIDHSLIFSDWWNVIEKKLYDTFDHIEFRVIATPTWAIKSVAQLEKVPILKYTDADIKNMAWKAYRESNTVWDKDAPGLLEEFEKWYIQPNNL